MLCAICYFRQLQQTIGKNVSHVTDLCLPCHIERYLKINHIETKREEEQMSQPKFDVPNTAFPKPSGCTPKIVENIDLIISMSYVNLLK